MPYENLADFLSELEDDGELVRVAAEVDPQLEVTEIVDRVCKSSPEGGPALFFERVRGRSMPLVVNLLGSRRRMCRALGAASFDEVAARIVSVLQPDVPEGWLETLRLVPQFAQLAKMPPQVVRTGVSQQVVKLGRDVDLRDLPIPTCWPEDSGPTITAGQVFTKSAAGIRNVGLSPLQVRDPRSLFVHWHTPQGGWRNFIEHQRAGTPMPVAIALGGDPVCTYAAHVPLPAHTDELLFAGFLRGKNVALVKCRTIEMEAPADAEIIIEGQIDTTAPLETAGPLGGPTGFYAPPEPVPVLQVTAVTHRSNPLFPAIIPGRPPMEDAWMARATERIFLPLVRLALPELVDLHWPQAGAFRNLLFASIRKEYPQHARKVMNALWGLPSLMGAKFIVIVDADVDVHDEERVWFAAGANAHPGRDVVFCEGPTSVSDHAAPIRGVGHKLGIDATRKLADEGHPRPWPDELRMKREIEEMVARRWGEYGLATKIEDRR